MKFQSNIVAVINLNFQVSSAILSGYSRLYYMAKKKTKKTLDSTRKMETTVDDREDAQKKEKKKGFGKIFSKSSEGKSAKGEQKSEPKNEPRTSEIVVTDKHFSQNHTVEKNQGESKTSSKEKRKNSPRKQKIKGGILMLIGIFALSFIGYFLFGKMFQAQSIAELLPEDTVGILEINIDGASSQTKKFISLLGKYPAYSQEGLIQLVNLLLPIDYKNDLEPWLGRRIGMAIIGGKSQDQGINRVYFIESRDREKAIEFLKNRAADRDDFTSTDYNGHTIYSYKVSQMFHGTFLNDYLVIGENAEIIKQLIDHTIGSELRLSDNADYRKVANNLPQGALIFGYVNIEKLFDVLSKDPKFAAEKGQDLMAFKTFIHLFKAEGVTIFAEEKRLAMQTFTALNKEALDGQNFITFNEKYQGELLNLANEETVLFAGGHDITKELNRIQEIFTSSTGTSSLIFEGLLEAQKFQYFGKDISMNEDIYPLLSGEYLFTVENSFEKPIITLFLELKDKNKDTQRLEKVMAEFIKTSGFFTPHVQEVTLPDGTKGQEIVAVAEKIERSEEKYNDANITLLRIGNTGWSIAYTIIDDVAIFSTNKESLTKIIDRKEGTIETNLRTTPFFNENIQPVLRTADEIMNVKLGAVTQFFGLNEDSILSNYFVPFANLTITKNYFEDGISTIYLIEVI